MNDANFDFLRYMYMKRNLLKLYYLFCIVLVCSKPQQVFKYIKYLKSLFLLEIYFIKEKSYLSQLEVR